MKSKRIRIFDTTLRDGEQTPGVSFTPDQKVEIARQLDALGVDVIEVGTPITSDGDRKAAKMVSKLELNSKICGLARVVRSDIDAAIACNVDRIHTFVSTSDIQIKHALSMSREQVLSAAVDSIQYVKDHGLICQFSPMDATRTDPAFLKKICLAAEDAGADIINIPDTVGIMTPYAMKRLIEDVEKVISVPISVHCHDDFGMAVANTLAGVEGGATQVEVAVNGLGERAGNAALEEAVMAIHLIYNWKTGINTKLIYRTSHLVSRISGVLVQPNKAIVGENAFAHESGIHTRGIAEAPLTFEPIKPELVGRRRRLVAGKVSGTRGVKAELEDMGFHPTREQLNMVVTRVKELGDKGKIVTDVDLMSIARAVLQEGIVEEKSIELNELAVMTGTRMTPTASVKVLLNGNIYSAAETGVGPVDAVIRAVQKITSGLVDVRLKEYRLEALTGGSDALAEVIIKVEDKDGNLVSARAANEDIVRASIDALIMGINRLLSKRRR